MNCTPKEFEDLFNFACEQAAKQLATHPKDVIPMLFIRADQPDGQTAIVWVALNCDFNTPEEKHSAMRGIGKMLFEKRQMPLAVVSMMEAWCSHQPKGPFIAPSEAANRYEVIHIAGVSWDGKLTASVNQRVRRDDKGGMVADGEPKRYPGRVEHYLIAHLFEGFANEARASVNEK
jgi:hypothetical protein